MSSLMEKVISCLKPLLPSQMIFFPPHLKHCTVQYTTVCKILNWQALTEKNSHIPQLTVSSHSGVNRIRLDADKDPDPVSILMPNRILPKFYTS